MAPPEQSGLILVDTSAWIEFLQSPASQVHEEMARLIRGTNRVATCGLVVQELLQGLKSPRSVNLLRSRLERLPFFTTRKSTYVLAAEIFRKLRQKGVQVQTVDATIAAIALENRAPILTLNQRHFIPMCEVSKLRLHTLSNQKAE
jgi:predicted nucleic acid-binding protein